MMNKILENILPDLADEKLVGTRMAICLGCKFRRDTPLIGSTCGRFLFPSYGFLSRIVRIFKPDFQRGKKTCGCDLNIKWKLLNWHCPQFKW